MINLKENDLVFAKVDPNAKIPTKKYEDAGRDVYACFEQDYIVIPPHETVLIPTGIASAMSQKYEIRLCDRGSNGSKGIHVMAGTIDSGFRGQWFVAWCNTNTRDVILSKLTYEELVKKYGKKDEDEDIVIPTDPMNEIKMDKENKYPICNHTYISWADFIDRDKVQIAMIYPYTKAICQAEVREVPVMNQYEVTYNELLTIHSERGTGELGSSGK